MENEAELTRRYLLNSHSRGSLEEVISVDEPVELESGLVGLVDGNSSGNQLMNLFEGEQAGKEKIAEYLRQYYS